MSDRFEKPITRRGFLQSSAALTLVAPVVMADSGKPRKQNILFLMDDQHRGDCVGVDGNKIIKTPNLDRLAADGIWFRKAYASMPSCLPARTSLLTGQSPWGHGLLGYSQPASHYPNAKPRLMHDAGYYAMCIGKNHFNPTRNTHGYDRVILNDYIAKRPKSLDDYFMWFDRISGRKDPTGPGVGENDRRGRAYAYPDEWHSTHWVGQNAVDFLNGYKDERPFFLKVSFHRPHTPNDPPQRFMDLYKDAELPKAQVGSWAQKWYGNFTNPNPPEAPRANIDPALIRSSRQGYYGNISFVDEQIGRILDTLQKRDMLDNTLIVFCADHGEMGGDQHLWRKTYAYEPSARIPMIVRWPKDMLDAPRGQVRSELVELRDVLPTFLDAAGGSIPKSIEGRSMLELVRGKKDWRTTLDLEHSTCYFPENVWTALTDGKFKYIFHAFHGRQQLFDLETDPHELADLSGDVKFAKELNVWRQRMVDHLSIRGDKWVKNGQLALRTKPMHYGPNFPEKTPAKG